MRNIIVIATCLLAVGTLSSPPPITAFTNPVQFQDAKISPGGDYIAAAMIDPQTGNGRFRVVERATGETVVSFGMGEERRVNSFNWADDDTILLTPARKVSGEDFYASTYGLMNIDVTSGVTKDLPPAGIISMLNFDPEHILIVRLQGRFLEVFKMNFESGTSQKLARAAVAGGSSFIFNHDGDIVFNLGANEEGEHEVHYREGRDEWELLTVTPFGFKGWAPISPAFKEGTYFTRDSRNGSTAGLGLFDTKTRKHTSIYRDKTVDIAGLQRDFEHNVWGVSLEHPVHPIVQYLNPKHPLSKLHQAITAQHKDARIRFTSYTRDNTKVIAELTSDRKAGEFYLFDAKSQKAEFIANRRPDLDSKDLASVHPIPVTTRDGETIYGFVTIHPNTPRPGPMVVNIHGGPYGVRDYWGFDGTNQILATRGYHVLQVNYRGSGGYGVDFENAGHGEWGGLMQDDVTDATKWAIENGVADPKRICITGGSYGAYSALMALAREPDLYQCAIGRSGVYDITIMTKRGDTRQSRAGMIYLRTIFGRDEDYQKSISPAYLADKLRSPIMLIHGGMDRRTPPAHAHAMRKALQDVGRAPEWLFDSGQGHGFVGEETNRNLWARQLEFLNKHIGTTKVATTEGE